MQAGARVEIWTICAGDPPVGDLTPFAASLHERWKTGISSTKTRRTEDEQAAHRLGAATYHFSVLDCIYRRVPATGDPVITGEEDLWQPLCQEELPLAHSLTDQLHERLPVKVNLVSPLCIGAHVDHRLTCIAAEGLHVPLYYYADYPYAARKDAQDWIDPHWQRIAFKVTPHALQAWQEAVAAYISQISTFWSDLEQMQAAIREYWQNRGGCSLYRK